MGNSEGSTWISNANQWRMISQTKLGYVIEGPENKQAQIYTIRIPSNKLPLYESFFQKRKNKPGCMIRIFDYYKNNKLVCSSDALYSVVTERLIRLKELRGLSYLQSITMIKQILILYQNLQQTFGYFKLQPQMIGRTVEGHIKIWINQNLGQNICSQQSQIRVQNHIQIVRRVCKIVSTKSGQYSSLIQNLFSQNKFNRYNLQKFVQILSKIQINKESDLNILIKKQISQEPRSHLKQQNKELIDFKQSNKTNYISNNLQQAQNRLPLPVKSVSNYQKTFNYPITTHFQPIYQFAPKMKQQKILSNNSITQFKSILPTLNFTTIPLKVQNNFRTNQNKYDNFDHSLFVDPNNIKTYKQITDNKRIQQTQVQNIEQTSFDTPQPYFTYIQTLPLYPIYEQCHQNPIYQAPQSTTYSTPRYSLANNTPVALATELSLQPISTLLSSSNSSLKLVSSHVFITNDDLYSHLDDMIQNQKVKLQQSQIIRRLQNKNSKVSQ